MRDDDEPNVCIGEALRDLGRKETGDKEPDEGVDGVFSRFRVDFHESQKDKYEPERYCRYEVAHNCECDEGRNS